MDGMKYFITTFAPWSATGSIYLYTFESLNLHDKSLAPQFVLAQSLGSDINPKKHICRHVWTRCEWQEQMLFASSGARIVLPTLLGCVCYFVCGSRLRDARSILEWRPANDCNFLRDSVEVSAFKNINNAGVLGVRLQSGKGVRFIHSSFFLHAAQTDK